MVISLYKEFYSNNPVLWISFFKSTVEKIKSRCTLSGEMSFCECLWTSSCSLLHSRLLFNHWNEFSFHNNTSLLVFFHCWPQESLHCAEVLLRRWRVELFSLPQIYIQTVVFLFIYFFYFYGLQATISVHGLRSHNKVRSATTRLLRRARVTCMRQVPGV